MRRTPFLVKNENRFQGLPLAHVNDLGHVSGMLLFLGCGGNGPAERDKGPGKPLFETRKAVIDCDTVNAQH